MNYQVMSDRKMKICKINGKYNQNIYFDLNYMVFLRRRNYGSNRIISGGRNFKTVK